MSGNQPVTDTPEGDPVESSDILETSYDDMEYDEQLENLADDIDSSRQYSQHTDAARIHNEKSNRLLTNMKTKTVFKKKKPNNYGKNKAM